MNPIDEFGNAIDPGELKAIDGKAILKPWIVDRFGKEADQQIASVD